MNATKKILALVLSLVLICLSFAGCGSKSNTQKEFGSLYDDKSSEERLVFKKRDIKGDADLEVFWFSHNVRDDVKDAAAMYKDLYGGNIEYYLSSWNDRATDLALLNSAKQLPDVLLGFQETDFPTFTDMGLFGEIKENEFDFKSKYVEKAFIDSILTKDSKMYGIAIKDDPEIVIYNKDIITKLGYETPYQMWKNGTWTWDTMKTLAKKLSLDTDEDGNIDRYGFNAWSLKSLFATNNTWPLISVNGKPTLNVTDKAMTEAFQLIYDMNNVDKSFSPEVGETAFISGKVAMYIERPQYIYHFINNGVDADAIEIAPVPKGPSATENYAYFMPSIAGIGNSCQKKEAALAFIECYISVQAEMSKTGPRESYGYTYSEEQTEVMDAIKKDYKSVNVIPTGYGNVNNSLNGILAELLKGTTVSAAVERYKSKMQSELK